MAEPLKINPILLTDSYKVTHWRQYPPGTEQVYSYFESRGGLFPETTFYGLQYILKAYLEGSIITKEAINEAEQISALHFNNKKLFNREGWEYILKEHGGKLPVSIKAVPEGTVVPTHNALITVEVTDPKCYWLTNYLETLLVQVWYSTTVATLSMNIKRLITKYLDETGDPSGVEFKLQDFGFRGSTSVESAAIGGSAHLVNFKGTDTMIALMLLRQYYKAEMAGFSIPAAEHSTITAWRRELESDAFANMLKQFPDGYVAVVSDSYNIFDACSKLWGEKLKEQVLGRNGTLVVRPDSGYPPEIVLKVIELLGEKFGYTTNTKGYKVMNEKVRVIQGDGVDYVMIDKILSTLKEHGWSADNIAFGMGGGLLQKLDRDTQKFAFKCSSATVNGEERDVFKQPITDPGKNSKAGRLKVVLTQEGVLTTVSAKSDGTDNLVEVFRNGRILKEYTLDEIRGRVNAFLAQNKEAAKLLRSTEKTKVKTT